MTVEAKSTHFLFSLIFDIIFFSVCVCIWLYIRKNRDENKINDNIYILSKSANSEIKNEQNSCTQIGEANETRQKSSKFQTFLNIKDDKIVNTEIKYYLFFLKTNRNIVFSLCVLGTFVVLPVYLVLPRKDKNNLSFLNYLSAVSVSNTNVMLIRFFITIVYSIISYSFIYLLWRKIKPSKQKAKGFLPQNFTIMVSNVNRNDIDVSNIYNYFCNLTNNKIVSAYLILDYSNLFNIQKKILNASKNLKMLKENEKKETRNIRSKSTKNFLKIFWRDKKKKTNDSFTTMNAKIMKLDAEKANIIASNIFVAGDNNIRINKNTTVATTTTTTTNNNNNNITATSIDYNTNGNISDNNRNTELLIGKGTNNTDSPTMHKRGLSFVKGGEGANNANIKKHIKKNINEDSIRNFIGNNEKQIILEKKVNIDELNKWMCNYNSTNETDLAELIVKEYAKYSQKKKNNKIKKVDGSTEVAMEVENQKTKKKTDIKHCCDNFRFQNKNMVSKTVFREGNDEEDYNNMFKFFFNIFKKKRKENKNKGFKHKETSKSRYKKRNEPMYYNETVHQGTMGNVYKRYENYEDIRNKKKTTNVIDDRTNNLCGENDIVEIKNGGNFLSRKKNMKTGQVVKAFNDEHNITNSNDSSSISSHNTNNKKDNIENDNNRDISNSNSSEDNDNNTNCNDNNRNKSGGNHTNETNDIAFKSKQKKQNKTRDDKHFEFFKFTSDEDETLSEEQINKRNNSNNALKVKILSKNNNFSIKSNATQTKNDDRLNYQLIYRKLNKNVSDVPRSTSHKFFNLLHTDNKINIFNTYKQYMKEKRKSYWKNEMKENLIKFYELINETPKKSSGVCFVSFIDTKSVHDCIHNIPYTETNNKWIISKAPPNYDIIWKNLKNPTYQICARFVILNALLLLINIIIITIVSSIDKILNVREKKFDDDRSKSRFSVAITAWFSPFIVIFVNSIIQPVLITCVSVMVGFIRKSNEHTYVLKGNFMFLILNTIIIPLLSLSPLNAFLKLVYEKEIENLSERLGEILFNSSGFFAMRYIMHCYFLTCANQLLQIPQFSIRSIYEKITKKETEAWTFDFGYWYAFNTSMLALILTFSVTVPLILPLGSLYFFLRYYIDKYNLIYEICRTNLDSHGAIIKTALKFMLFSVAFFQVVMFGFFSQTQNRFIAIGRNVLFLSSSLTFLLLLCRSTEWVRTYHIKKKRGVSTFCYSCEKNVYVSNVNDLNKLKHAYVNPCEANM